MSDSPASLPALPPPTPPEELRDYEEARLADLAGELKTLERATLAAMAPFDAHLKEIRARLAELSTERRRRERQAHIEKRAAVRQAAKSGEMPSLAAALAEGLEIAASTPLQNMRTFLSSGGEVRLGFPTKPGVLSFTNGRAAESATTWGDALKFYREGWQFGVAGVPGVRVHLLGTRNERVVAPEDVLVAPA